MKEVFETKMPKENTMSEHAVRLEACTVCGRPLPPVFGFSYVCKDCREHIERGEIMTLDGRWLHG